MPFRVRTPHPGPREPPDQREGEELEVLVLEETSREVGSVGVLHERVGEVDHVSQGEEDEGNVVRVAVLINLAISDGNKRESNSEEVQAKDGRGQELLQVVLSAQLGSRRGSGRTSRRLHRLRLGLLAKTIQ